MILKLAAVSVLLAVCWAIPVEDKKDVEVAPTAELVPLEPKPGKVEGSPKPGKPDDSDLKEDASTWWHHSWQYHEVPVYYYTTHQVMATGEGRRKHGTNRCGDRLGKPMSSSCGLSSEMLMTRNRTMSTHSNIGLLFYKAEEGNKDVGSSSVE